MPRDYKHRAHSRTGIRRNSRQNQGVAWWKWLMVVVVIAMFVAFLLFLRDSGTDKTGPKPVAQKKAATTVKVKKKTPAKAKQQSEEPRFDFYTILPEKEVVVPDYEQKTRTREESVGKAKSSKYLLQAGSFRDFSEADKLRARLALMGIESRVEKAKVGAVTWHRVKMGPYSRMSSVNTLKSRLRQNGIDVMVMELGG